jgi:hypothetical protein
MIASRATLLGLPLVRAADAIADAAGPELAEALLAWAELLVERLDGRNAAALAGGLRRLATMERRQDISDRVTFHDPLSPY